tara:strand:+ start:56 stop:499 length:444 start_codon:yes stop_codon:yes gene_type:complete
MAITAPFTGQKTELHMSTALSGVLSASTLVGEVDDLGAFETTRNMVDLLSYGDDDLRKLTTTRDNGSISVTCSWMPSDADHDALATAYQAGTLDTYAVQWVSGAADARVDFSAYVSSYSVSNPKDDKVTVAVELTISGAVVYDLTPA